MRTKDFLCEVSKLVLEYTRCDAVELRLREGEYDWVCEAGRESESACLLETKIVPHGREGDPFGDGRENPAPRPRRVYESVVEIPVAEDGDSIGVLLLKSKRPSPVTDSELERFRRVGRVLAGASVNQRAQAALRERIKELTCLYGIARTAERRNLSREDLLQEIVQFLPPAWQYPDITSGQIMLDGRSYRTPGFHRARQQLSANIVVLGRVRGSVEVVYTEVMPELDEGPFLKEERSLINAVAREVAIIIERGEAEQEKSELHEQVRHADRLATIGLLAAGVAHELNEPLGSILGFAQLTKKCERLPPQADQDLEKIVTATLHAREVVKKLMLFARQVPPNKTEVSLNKVVEEALYFLEAQCAEAGIELVRELTQALPEISADPAQLRQLLVNLVVNSLQAMPEGGRLTVQTTAGEGHLSLVVEDTGVGMSPDIMNQAFLPFFTTKDVGEGTGLGLAVVHGIVTAYGGSIGMESEPGKGTRFEVRLPVDPPPDASVGRLRWHDRA